MSQVTSNLTFLFTDIEGSTRLWEKYPDTMRSTLLQHDDLLRACIECHGGRVFKTMGDAFCAVFPEPGRAVEAVIASQQWLPTLSLCTEDGERPLRVRMALHTGPAEERDGDYFGRPLNRVARLLAVGHGGQVLLSGAAQEAINGSLPPGAALQNRGSHRLRDLSESEIVFQLLHPDLVAEFPPLRSLSTHPNNLPLQVTSFIGGERAIAELRVLMGSTRLLTLTGSGGCGKTRLALQLGADSLEQYLDGVWIVELAAVSDPTLVPQAVATELGLKEELGKSMSQTIVDNLKSKQLLLLLDNCEHLLDACAKLADTVARQCPNVGTIATSREGLGIAGETTYRVPSLAAPDPKLSYTAQSLANYDAVRLFVERAEQVSPAFQVTDQNASAIASICHRLDGIPLAIELAAARVRSLTVDDINGKLDQRFRLLTGSSRTALPRQQTLRSLIDWSYHLLNEHERALLRSISVFSGGWSLEAAESVCSGETIEEWEVLDLLTSLVNKSLVAADTSLSSARYRLMETIRQYARDRMLESGDGDHIRRRHMEYFVALGVDADGQIQGSDQALWLDRLETEHDNVRAALTYALAEDPAACMRMAGAMSRFWDIRGYFEEGRRHISDALAAQVPVQRTAERARALNGVGVLAYSQGDYLAAKAFLGECRAIYAELNDQPAIARSLSNLGLVALAQGDFAAARTVLNESLRIRRELGDQRGVAMSLDNLGLVTRSLGDIASARALHSEALAIRRQTGEQRGLATSLGNLANLAFDVEDYAVARPLHEESLTIRNVLGDRQGIAWSLCGLGETICAQGDLTGARALLEQSLAIQRELGDPQGMADAIEGLAEVDAKEGNILRAARLWGATERLRDEIGATLSSAALARRQVQVAAARRELGNEVAFDAAWRQGRAMTQEMAIEMATEPPSPP